MFNLISSISPWTSPGKNTGVGCHFLLQGIVLSQGSNSGLLHCRQILYHLSHEGTPPPQNQENMKKKYSTLLVRKIQMKMKAVCHP